VCGPRWSFFALTGLSAAFYAYSGIGNLGLVLATTVMNYSLGLLLQQGGLPRRRFVLAIGIAANLGVLCYFKYFDFLAMNLEAGLNYAKSPQTVALPLGLSFFLFQQISYIVDCFRRDAGTKDFPNYGLFVLFFPHIIAGPIVRAAILLPQFRSILKCSPGHLVVVGLGIFILGLGKKILFADQLALLANPIYALAETRALTLLEAWTAALSFTFQMYFDFSGYSDMAIGLAAAFGIRLPINFDSPYKATSLVDFWRRWHITLSEWLRDYLYIPLGGSRAGRARQYTNLIVTMLLGGCGTAPAGASSSGAECTDLRCRLRTP
jgi:alginate O-acetyltransferase complex protein AlgI